MDAELVEQFQEPDQKLKCQLRTSEEIRHFASDYLPGTPFTDQSGKDRYCRQVSSTVKDYS